MKEIYKNKIQTIFKDENRNHIIRIVMHVTNIMENIVSMCNENSFCD